MDREKPAVSVIVPVYQVEGLLARCVNSLLAQSLPGVEIVLVDDGSPDGCGALCDSFAAQHKNVVALHQANQGVSAARNTGLAAARGDYIGFVDSDDWAEPDMLRLLLESQKKNGTMLSVCGHFTHRDGKTFDDTCAFPEYMPQSQALARLIDPKGFQGFLWNKLFSRKLLEQAGGGQLLLLDRRLHVCEDLLYTSQCVLAAEHISYVGKPLYHYCHRSSSAIYAYNREKRSSEFIAIDEIIRLYENAAPQLAHMAKLKYADVAYNLLRAAAKSGDRGFYPQLRAHAKKYLNTFMGLGFVGPGRKLAMLCAIAFPNAENNVKALGKSLLGRQ